MVGRVRVGWGGISMGIRGWCVVVMVGRDGVRKGKD